MTIFARELAPAKLNLYLHILGRDQRGYHLLDSLVTFADAVDWVTVTEADHLSLIIDGPFGEGLATDSSNLVWRAAMGLAEVTGHHPDFTITLTKNLPIASGIGGGSSDAAACLRALARIWGIPITDPVLIDVAKTLGSDLPVCVGARTCYMGGVGDHIEVSPPLPQAAIVLVNPGYPLSTREVYAARQGSFSDKAHFETWPITVFDLALFLKERHNDLMPAAFSLKPELHMVTDALEAQSGCLLARMLGSGATCFGLFDKLISAQLAAKRVQAINPTWWVHAGQLVNDLSAMNNVEEALTI